MNIVLRACLAGFTALLLTETATAQTLITGTTGYLSEWQFSIALDKEASAKEVAVPVTWKHVGVCSANGAPEKRGDIDIQISHMGPWSRLNASISFEQLRCTYSGRYAETVTGFMQCSDKTSLPLTLLFK